MSAKFNQHFSYLMLFMLFSSGSYRFWTSCRLPLITATSLPSQPTKGDYRSKLIICIFFYIWIYIGYRFIAITNEIRYIIPNHSDLIKFYLIPTLVTTHNIVSRAGVCMFECMYLNPCSSIQFSILLLGTVPQWLQFSRLGMAMWVHVSSVFLILPLISLGLCMFSKEKEGRAKTRARAFKISLFFQ